MSKRYRIVLISVGTLSVLLFVIITTALYINNFEPGKLDILIRDTAYNIRGNENSFWGYFWKIYTNIGIALILFLGLFIVIIYRFKLGTKIIFFGTASTWLIDEIMKKIVMRERPMLDYRWLFEESSSYPSGHSMVSAYFYWTLCFFVHLYVESKWQRQIMYAGFCLLILTIGLSRIILGLHYFTDVVSGFSFGLICSTFSIFIYERIKSKPTILEKENLF